MVATTAALPVIGELVSQIVTQLFNIALTYLIAKWDCLIWSAHYIQMRLMLYGEDSPVNLPVAEQQFVRSFDFKMRKSPEVSSVPPIHYWPKIWSP